MSGEKRQVTDADRLANLQSEAQTERSLRVKAEADAKRWEERFDKLLAVTLEKLKSRYED